MIPIREEIITSTETMVGARGSLLNPRPESCALIKLEHPILTNEELEKLRHVNRTGFKCRSRCRFCFTARGRRRKAWKRALDKLFAAADKAIADGANILILSDRGVSREHGADSRAAGRGGPASSSDPQGTRGKVGLVLESGEPREVHHFALLIGYGCSAINPYLAFETLDDLIQRGSAGRTPTTRPPSRNTSRPPSKAWSRRWPRWASRPFKAIAARKFLKPSASTATSWTSISPGRRRASRRRAGRHRRGSSCSGIATRFRPPGQRRALDAGGQYQWRDGGEFHLFNPQTIHKLQIACRLGSEKIYREYAELINNQATNLCTLRGLLDFKSAEKPLPIEEVESVEAIVKRFKTGAMSYGSISKEAHETLAIAMNRIGGKSNTGEGGEDPDRYVLDAQRRLEEFRHQTGRVAAGSA